MTLTDAFVRVNRARGLELVSPEDILGAAQALAHTHIPMKLHVFDSGVLVLVTANNSEEEVRQDMMNHLESAGSFTPEEMSRVMSLRCHDLIITFSIIIIIFVLSVILARERLLAAEGAGLLARDDTVEGLRFFPNRFLTT